MSSSSNKLITLITGANSGIGFTLAALLLGSARNHVLLGSRSTSKGETALKDLQAKNLPGSLELLQLDVTDETSIAQAAENVKKTHGRLDALVNNAGIFAFPEGTSMKEKLQQSFLANATGVQLVTDAFLPLLQKSSSTPRIINVSSGAGSLSVRLDPAFDNPLMSDVVHYQASKAAVNMISTNMYRKLEPEGVKVFLYNPGFTESNLGPHNKESMGAKSTVEGTKPMVEMLEGKRDEWAGKNCFVRKGTDEWGEHGW